MSTKIILSVEKRKRNRYMNGQVDVAGLHADQIFFEVWRLLNQIRGTVRGFGNSVGNTHQIFKIYTHLSRARHVRQISDCGKMRRDVEEKVNVFSLCLATRCTRRQFEARSRSSTTLPSCQSRSTCTMCIYIHAIVYLLVSCHVGIALASTFLYRLVKQFENFVQICIYRFFSSLDKSFLPANFLCVMLDN